MININLIKDDFIYFLTNENGFFRRKIGIGELAAPFDPLGVFKYTGTKSIRLAARQKSDPRWLTEKQCNDAGYIIKQGAVGVELTNCALMANGRYQEMTVDVYNAKDITGMPAFKRQTVDQNEAFNNLKKMIISKKITFLFSNSYRGDCRYMTPDNIVYRPATDRNMEPDEFNAAAIHELAKVECRRFDMTNPDAIRYSMIVLSATIASYMLAVETGMSAHPLTNKREIGKIVDMIEEYPAHIFRAGIMANSVKDSLIRESNSQAMHAEPRKQYRRQHNRDTGGLEY